LPIPENNRTYFAGAGCLFNRNVLHLGVLIDLTFIHPTKSIIMRAFIPLVLLLAFAELYAQPIQIGFSGSGLTSSVDSVEVLNLTQGTILTLAGTDILELVTNTGITQSSFSGNWLHVYPNPVERECRIGFSNHQADFVCLELFDGTGKLILRKEEMLSAGSHAYQLEGLSQGLFVLKVTTHGFSLSKRVISTGKTGGLPDLKYTGMTSGALDHARVGTTTSTIQMAYNPGEMLLFKGVSGIYSRVITLEPITSQTVNFEFIDCTDGDGNHYPVVTIGTQTWMAENLRTTKYRNGLDIIHITSNATWTLYPSGARCWYNNDSASYAAIYGSLYNQKAVKDTSGLCPAGWHIPTDAEWMTMEIYLGMPSVSFGSEGMRGTIEGGKLKATGTQLWNSPNTDATNITGFTALPGGYRYHLDGEFRHLGNTGIWWANYPSGSTIYTRGLYYSFGGIYRGRNDYRYDSGCSVRCILD
jgi:uncharacterized protein (TIGR02145 family)